MRVGKGAFFEIIKYFSARSTYFLARTVPLWSQLLLPSRLFLVVVPGGYIFLCLQPTLPGVLDLGRAPGARKAARHLAGRVSGPLGRRFSCERARGGGWALPSDV